MQNSTHKQQTLALIYDMVEKAYDAGAIHGFQVGQSVGFVAGLASAKAALSDGLRHGSPVCAQAMRTLRQLGLDEPIETNE